VLNTQVALQSHRSVITCVEPAASLHARSTKHIGKELGLFRSAIELPNRLFLGHNRQANHCARLSIPTKDWPWFLPWRLLFHSRANLRCLWFRRDWSFCLARNNNHFPRCIQLRGCDPRLKGDPLLTASLQFHCRLTVECSCACCCWRFAQRPRRHCQTNLSRIVLQPALSKPKDQPRTGPIDPFRLAHGSKTFDHIARVHEIAHQWHQHEPNRPHRGHYSVDRSW